MGESRSTRRSRRDEGFTLIELLVVVIVIGVLAAIAVPVYIGMQNGANDSAVQSDLGNAKTAVVSHLTSSNSYVALASLKDDGYPGPSAKYAATADQPSYKGGTLPASTGAFCIEAKSPSTKTFYATESGGIKQGTCP